MVNEITWSLHNIQYYPQKGNRMRQSCCLQNSSDLMKPVEFSIAVNTSRACVAATARAPRADTARWPTLIAARRCAILMPNMYCISRSIWYQAGPRPRPPRTHRASPCTNVTLYLHAPRHCVCSRNTLRVHSVTGNTPPLTRRQSSSGTYEIIVLAA